MKCILHIGTATTGTTTLQEWLYSNRSALSAQKVYLSDICGKPDNRYLSYFFEPENNKSICKLFDEGNDEDDFNESFLNRLSSEIRVASKDHYVFVVSSEYFHSRVTSPEDISSLASFLNEQFNEINVVCYFRNQHEMAISAYSTALRVGSSLSINEYLSSKVTPDNYFYDFLQIAQNWSECFGKDNCIFRIYNRVTLIDGDIRKDFLSEALPAIHCAEINFDTDSANKSFTYLQAAALRMINKHIPYTADSQSYSNHLNKYLRKQAMLIKNLEKGVVEARYRSEVDRIVGDSNKEFFNKYIKQSEGFDSPDKAIEKDLRFSLDEVGEMVADIFDTLLPMVSSKATLVDGDAVALRDIALKIERKELTSVRDSLALMKLAKRARTNGPFISKKIKQYEAELEGDFEPHSRKKKFGLINILNSKIGYFPIPKVACTSIKEFMYEVEYHEPFKPKGKIKHVHTYFQKRFSGEKLESYNFSFVVIRDPIKRFLSAYSNRVTHHKELSQEFILSRFPQYAERLPFHNPSLQQFIDHIDTYMQIPPIQHHIEPVSVHLTAEQLQQFSNIYPIENISSLEADLSAVLDCDVKFGRSQTGGRKFSLGELNLSQIETLLDFYAEDYQMLGEFYSADMIMQEWAKSHHSV
jgi:hypothetical protein